MTNEDLAKPPDIKQLQRIQSWYEPALKLLNDLLSECRSNLEQRNYDIKNAAVLRQEWREQMQYQFRINWTLSEEIEKSLHKAKKVNFMGRYVKPVEMTND